MSKLFYLNQFSLAYVQFSSIWPISGATTSGQSGLGSDDYEGVLCIPQGSNITGVSPSDCLVSYLGHSLVGWGAVEGSYSSAEVQLAYSTAPANWASILRPTNSGLNSNDRNRNVKFNHGKYLRKKKKKKEHITLFEEVHRKKRKCLYVSDKLNKLSRHQIKKLKYKLNSRNKKKLKNEQPAH